MPAAPARRRHVDDAHDGAPSRSRRACSGESGVLGLDPHRLGVADEHRHADGRRADRQLGQLEDLARLGAELRLLVELVAVEVPVHAQVVLVGRLRAQLLHPLRAGARDRLVRRRRARARGRLRRAAASARTSAGSCSSSGSRRCRRARARARRSPRARRAGCRRLEPVRRRLVDARPRRRAPRAARARASADVPTEKSARSRSPAASASGVASSTTSSPSSVRARPSAPTRRRARSS